MLLVVAKLKDLIKYYGFSIRITGKSGIRCVSGIGEATKTKLLNEGIEGYKLKEYGTLIIPDQIIDEYPLIKGGSKVALGKSYGYEADGSLKNVVFDVNDGRIRFTGVLVGLKPSQYKTDFAFRGYAVLTKDGEDVVIYGQIVARNIYYLAERSLNRGEFKEGSAADLFLKKLIADADALETPDEGGNAGDVSGGDAADGEVSGGDAASGTVSGGNADGANN